MGNYSFENMFVADAELDFEIIESPKCWVCNKRVWQSIIVHENPFNVPKRKNFCGKTHKFGWLKMSKTDKEKILLLNDTNLPLNDKIRWRLMRKYDL